MTTGLPNGFRPENKGANRITPTERITTVDEVRAQINDFLLSADVPPMIDSLTTQTKYLTLCEEVSPNERETLDQEIRAAFIAFYASLEKESVKPENNQISDIWFYYHLIKTRIEARFLDQAIEHINDAIRITSHSRRQQWEDFFTELENMIQQWIRLTDEASTPDSE